MEVLTEDAVLVCAHESGIVGLAPVQAWVTINGRRVLIEPDPEGRPIAACANVGPTIKPCTTTLKVEAGYSAFVTVNGSPLCLQPVTGKTDGTPPGVVDYHVRSTGQHFVNSEA
jgi:hypothetical protein